MGRSRKQRRQQHGSAWHWAQTDCWYYTLPGTRNRMPLFDESGQRIRGRKNQQAAETALAKVKVSNDSGSADSPSRQRWLVAKVCSEWGLDQLGVYAQLQYRLLQDEEKSLTAIYWRLGRALALAKKAFKHGLWTQHLKDLGIDNCARGPTQSPYCKTSTPRRQQKESDC